MRKLSFGKYANPSPNGLRLKPMVARNELHWVKNLFPATGGTLSSASHFFLHEAPTKNHDAYSHFPCAVPDLENRAPIPPKRSGTLGQRPSQPSLSNNGRDAMQRDVPITLRKSVGVRRERPLQPNCSTLERRRWKT
jgi:hypothetical protein